jgi:hypothetical protein
LKFLTHNLEVSIINLIYVLLVSFSLDAAEPSGQVSLNTINNGLSAKMINQSKNIDLESWANAKNLLKACLSFNSIKSCNYIALGDFMSPINYKYLEKQIDQICEEGLGRVKNINYLILLKNKKLTPNCLQLVQNRIEIIKYQRFIN